MPRRALFTIALLIALFTLPDLAQAQWHKDERFGFKIRSPKGWTQVPLQADEDWLVAKFLCDKTYIYNDKEVGWSWEHKPELMVIAFVEDVIRKGNEKADERERKTEEKPEDKGEEEGDEEEGEDEPEEVEERVQQGRPYQNYEDFLDRTLRGGGFYISEREESEAAGVPVTKYEVKIEKLTFTGPKRIITWVFHAPGIDFAVQCEVLEDAFPKLKNKIRSTMRSFDLIERTEGELPTDGRTYAAGWISMRSMSSGTPEERRERRQKSEQMLHERARESLLDGWKERKADSALVLHNCDAKYAQRVADHCDAVYEWLEQNLGFIGEDEYIRKPILRVCESEAEMRSLARGAQSSGSWWYSVANEIVTCKSDTGWAGWEMDRVNTQLFRLWLRDKDPDLWIALPTWIEHGLDEFLSGARLTGRKLKFKDYVRDLVEYKVARSQGKTMPVRDLIQLTQEEFWAKGGDWENLWNRMAQSDTFVRFLLSPEGSRNRLTRTLLADYVSNLGEVIEELEQEDFKENDELAKEPQTEEEEEELYKKRHERWGTSERERQIIQRTFSRTFGAWGEREWNLLEKAFQAYTG